MGATVIQLRRKKDLQELLGVKRPKRYAAANLDRLTGEWNPIDDNVNDLIANASERVRARIRQLVRDFPYFSRAVDVLATYTVGTGIQYQARVRDEEGNLIPSINQRIEDFWERFKEREVADISRRMHLDEMAELAKRQDCECGEFLLVKHYSSRRQFPFALQMYEADWLASDLTAPAKIASGNDIHSGIEYKKTTGEIVKYYFTDPDGYGNPVPISADRVIHGFHVKRPGQLRGISHFVPAVLIAHSLGDYIGATIDVAKLAARFLAFIETPDIEGFQKKRSTQENIETLQRAIIDYLDPGEKITFAENPNPGNQFDPFTRLVLTMIAVATGVPYELLSGDYRGLSWAVSRVGRTDFAQYLKPLHVRHVRHFYEPIKREAIQWGVLTGQLDLPGYWRQPWRYQRGEWYPPGMEPVDDLRETKANIDKCKVGLASPQEIARKRGRDLGDIYREIAEAKKLAEAHGISFDWDVPTGLAQNPAVLEDEDE